MKLRKINPGTAVFFGLSALIMYFISGLVQWILASRIPAYQAAIGTINPLQILVVAPIVGGVIVYVLTLILIFAYNVVAKKAPISWELDK